jgi:hypothetical protein
MRKIVILSAALLCAAPEQAIAAPACALASQKPMAMAELFFGLSVEGRGPVTDGEWRAFAARTLSHYFSDGFTAYEGDGQWLDPATHRIVRERSRIVQVVADDNVDFARNIQAVTDAYRKDFHQQSVGVVTEPVCAAF